MPNLKKKNDNDIIKFVKRTGHDIKKIIKSDSIKKLELIIFLENKFKIKISMVETNSLKVILKKIKSNNEYKKFI